jgi:hypothetical protein
MTSLTTKSDRVTYSGLEYRFGNLPEIAADPDLQLFLHTLSEDSFEFFVSHLLGSFTQLPDRAKLPPASADGNVIVMEIGRESEAVAAAVRATRLYLEKRLGHFVESPL